MYSNINKSKDTIIFIIFFITPDITYYDWYRIKAVNLIENDVTHISKFVYIVIFVGCELE